MEKFIKEVKSRKILWKNHSLRSLQLDKEVLKAWKEVSQACNLASGAAALRQWRQLCAEYQTELLRLKKNHQGTNKSKMKHIQLLDFMKNAVNCTFIIDLNFSDSSLEEEFNHINTNTNLNNETSISYNTRFLPNLTTKCKNTSSKSSKLIETRRNTPSTSSEMIEANHNTPPRLLRSIETVRNAPSASSKRKRRNTRSSSLELIEVPRNTATIPLQTRAKSLDRSSRASKRNKHKKKKRSLSNKDMNGNNHLKIRTKLNKNAPSSSKHKCAPLDTFSNASDSGTSFRTLSSKKTINPDLNFFKSLLPYMETFNPIEVLKVRSDIQNIVLKHYKDKLNRGTIEDVDTDCVLVSESRCESQNLTPASSHQSLSAFATDTSISQTYSSPLPTALDSNLQTSRRQNSSSDILSLNDSPDRIYNKNVARKTVQCKSSPGKFILESAIEHLEYSDVENCVKTEPEDCESNSTVADDLNQIIPKEEVFETDEIIQNLLSQLPPSVTVYSLPHSSPGTSAIPVGDDIPKNGDPDSEIITCRDEETESEEMFHEDDSNFTDCDQGHHTKEKTMNLENEEDKNTIVIEGDPNLDRRRCRTHSLTPVVALTRLEDLLGIENATVSDLQTFFMY